jgi:hypothetical protein
MQTHESVNRAQSSEKNTANGFRLQSYLLAALSLGMAVSLLFHFGCLWIYGEVLVVEPDVQVLLVETVGVGLALAFSVYCLVDALTQGQRHA